MCGCSKDCLILTPFRLPQISCFTLSLKCFSSDTGNCPNVGIVPLLQFPHPLRAVPVLLTFLFFPPSSFILPSFVWVYIFFSTCQVLSCPLSAGVLHAFLGLKVHSWWKTYSTSTYSSTILFSTASSAQSFLCINRPWGLWKGPSIPKDL